MTVDSELKRTFDALADRLHAEVERQVRAALAEVPARDADADTAITAPLPAAAAEPNLDAAVVAAIRAMDESRSLSNILGALATGAASGGGPVAVLLLRGGQWQSWRAIGCDPGADVAALAERASFPLRISGETIGAVYAERGPSIGLEILARHASRCLESMTAFRTARALVGLPDPARPAADGDEEDLSARRDEEDLSAQRYAKLLVSEIKLYHQNDVSAGCRERDLAVRLGEEIARARTLYEQRVPAHVRSRADYFHLELVRTLAEGDASLLEAHA